ncbi:MAG: ArsC family reductase [Pseudomonadales bacterium]
MSATLYGIKNCDSVKKARKWLESQQIDYQFHDFREQGLDRALLDTMLQSLEWKALLNTRSTTWRQLDAQQKDNIDRDSAIALMLEQPTLIKRPVTLLGERAQVGFKADAFSQLFLNT